MISQVKLTKERVNFCILFDAIGESFDLVGKKQDGVFVNILTDGDENDSKKYSVEDVEELFSEAEDSNWGVTFMGTTKDAVESAKSWGIKTGNTMQYSNDVMGTRSANNTRLKSKQMYFATAMNSTDMSNVNTDNLVDDE